MIVSAKFPKHDHAGNRFFSKVQDDNYSGKRSAKRVTSTFPSWRLHLFMHLTRSHEGLACRHSMTSYKERDEQVKVSITGGPQTPDFRQGSTHAAQFLRNALYHVLARTKPLLFTFQIICPLVNMSYTGKITLSYTGQDGYCLAPG
jgi:hypothetical protein